MPFYKVVWDTFGLWFVVHEGIVMQPQNLNCNFNFITFVLLNYNETEKTQ